METAKKTKPATCPCCGEVDPSWATTEHGLCDPCMQDTYNAMCEGDLLAEQIYEANHCVYLDVDADGYEQYEYQDY